MATKENCLTVDKETNIEDWCLFAYRRKLLIGLVISFSYMNGKTLRAREYSRIFAPVASQSSSVNPIGVLCTYFNLEPDGILHKELSQSVYVDITNYKGSILAPVFENNSLRIDELLSNEIKELQGNFYSKEKFHFLIANVKDKIVKEHERSIELEGASGQASTQHKCMCKISCTGRCKCYKKAEP